LISASWCDACSQRRRRLLPSMKSSVGCATALARTNPVPPQCDHSCRMTSTPKSWPKDRKSKTSSVPGIVSTQFRAWRALERHLLRLRAQRSNWSKRAFIPGRFSFFSCDRKSPIRNTGNSSSLMNPAWQARIRCGIFYDESGLKTGYCSSETQCSTRVLEPAVHSNNFRKQE